MNSPTAAPDPRSEMAFVLACARTNADEADLRRRLRSPLNWEIILELAAAHGVLALIYSTLARGFADAVPAAALDQMKACFIANVRNNLLMTKELGELVALLAAHDIPAVPYKGLALAHLAYPDRDLREISDIDLFVRRRDLERIRRLLPAHGYAPTKSPDDARAFERYSYHYSFQRVRSGRLIEIHWKFVRDARILVPDDGWPWADLRPITFDGISTQTFAPEDWLLLLCGHGAKHRWRHLGNVCDVAELIRRHDIRWEQVESAASRRGARRMLHLGLLAADDLMQAPVPAAVLNRARADQPAAALAAAVTSAIRSGGSVIERFSGVEGVAYDLQARERRRDRLSLVFQYFFDWEPNEQDTRLLPGAPPAVHRALRVWRLALKYGFGLTRRFLRQR